MLQKLKLKLLPILALMSLAIPAIAAPVALADTSPSIQNSLCSGANTLQISTDASGGTCNLQSGSTDRVNTIIRQVINVFSVVVGVVAVIMIIVGGFRYITSGGQAEKITSAKNTILYAIVGLIIVALAQIIVKFVLTKATTG